MILQYAVQKPNGTLFYFSSGLQWTEDADEARRGVVSLRQTLDKAGAVNQTVTLLAREVSTEYSTPTEIDHVTVNPIEVEPASA